ncbi:uncharacterized protein N7496_002722 [Penicillium cataractarum]|uniref:Uncharacterized protein n=1 Tax=Penicillium cataractarum TaxID=2100454 RepID=A0A9W9SMB2_9EURO|nr:uncharacterized protein N7496_002722 [Penicillium cataractarum]KAJ5380294.1 hypothetical protein N7496_002722 [Penicillium cataractarum]
MTRVELSTVKNCSGKESGINSQEATASAVHQFHTECMNLDVITNKKWLLPLALWPVSRLCRKAQCLLHNAVRAYHPSPMIARVSAVHRPSQR